MKKIFSIALCIALVMSYVPMVSLNAFAAAANGGNNAINGELTADITFNAGIITANSTNARCRTPIGSNDNQYRGTFDGVWVPIG